MKTSAFGLVELLMTILVIAVLGVLAVLASQVLKSDRLRSEMIQTMENAHQIQLSTQVMTRDNLALSGEHVHWTTLDANGKSIPITAGGYFDALIQGGYLSDEDLRGLLMAPGRYPDGAPLAAGNSCFKFFRVDDQSPADQPLMVTANWSDRQLTDDAPFGKGGFVIFTKGGSGEVFHRASDAHDRRNFPSGKDAAGHAYSYEVLK